MRHTISSARKISGMNTSPKKGTIEMTKRLSRSRKTSLGGIVDAFNKESANDDTKQVSSPKSRKNTVNFADDTKTFTAPSKVKVTRNR